MVCNSNLNFRRVTVVYRRLFEFCLVFLVLVILSAYDKRVILQFGLSLMKCWNGKFLNHTLCSFGTDSFIREDWPTEPQWKETVKKVNEHFLLSNNLFIKWPELFTFLFPLSIKSKLRGDLIYLWQLAYWLNKGAVKKNARIFIHILWISISSPPSLSTLADFK